jgi:hypothetical protein
VTEVAGGDPGRARERTGGSGDHEPLRSPEGDGLIRLSWGATSAFAVFALAGVAWPAARPLALAVDVVLFVAGCGAFLWAIAVAAQRSRTAEMGIGGLFFLAGSAPSDVRRHLLGSLGVQTAVALLTASLRLFTPLAGGILVPMLGLGLCGLWGARHGSFPARSQPSGR